MAYLNVVKVEEALRQMKETFQTFDSQEQVSLSTSAGRILADDLYAKENLPAFRRSMVDGYAVKSTDTFGASEQSPILLGYQGQVEMGKKSDQTLHDSMALYVPTGGEIPTGADAMIMIEHSERLGPDVAVFTTPRQGEHIVEIGEDVSADVCVLSKGTYLAPHHMGLLASLGISEVNVIRKPRVAILSTGDELVAVDEMPSYGQVRDCNRQIIESVVVACGCEVTRTDHIADDFEALKIALSHAVNLSDLVILSGGSSAGTKDMTQSLIESHSGQSNVFIHGLAIKPGKPTIIGSADHKPVIGLPGHPAACFITLKALVEPFVKEWIGQVEQTVKRVPCISDFQLYAASGRDVYQLVRLRETSGNGELTAEIVYGKSGMVSALANANAYVVVPMQHEGVMKGDALVAYLL